MVNAKSSCLFLMALLILFPLVSAEIGIKYAPNVICAPDTSQCLNDKQIRICASDGQTYEDKTCLGKCTFNETHAYCLNDIYLTQENQPSQSNIWLIFVAIIIGFVILGLILRKKK